MNRADVQEILNYAHVDPLMYSFERSDQEDTICLLPEGQIWKAFYYERGGRHGERCFPSEDEACLYFLKWVMRIAETS